MVLNDCSTIRRFAALHRCHFVIREKDMPAVVAIDKLAVVSPVIPGRQTHGFGGDSALADSVNGIDSALVRLGSGVLSTIKHWLQQVKL